MMTKTTQARKQRKRLFNLSLHQKRKLLSATLSKELRERFKRRSLTLRKGDRVRVLCGKFKDIEGEVVNISLSDSKVFVDKVVSKKRDGTDVLRPIPASNLILIEIDLRDKMRQKVLERKVSKTVVEGELRKEEERLKKEEAERKAKEAEEKKTAEKKTAEASAEDSESTTKSAKKISEKGIKEKTKKDWIAEK